MIISKFPPPSVGQKADGFIKLSTSYLDLPMTVGETGSFTFISLGSGEVTATSSDTGVCTASISGNTVTLTVTGLGTADITVSIAESGTNKAAEAVCSCANADPVLANNSPAMIKKMADAGTASSIWNVGDCTAPIVISVTSNLPNFTPPSVGVCAFIIGFDHNSTKEGSGIHFQFGKISNVNVAFVDKSGYGSTKTSGTWFNMNNSQSNTGGWSSSRMRTVTCPAFLACLPSAWQAVISDTIKYSDNTGGGVNSSSYVTATTDKIFLLSEYEVQGARSQANPEEQTKQAQYDYYKNGNSKIKYKHNATSTTCYWWLRSVRLDTTSFCRVSASGSASYSDVLYSFGFAPAFKVGGAAA